MAECMGFLRPEWGGTGNVGVLKRKFRWIFILENITTGTINALPCWKASRPKVQFREMQAEHLNETISFPSKPEWQPIQISLYDRCIGTQNPIFSWLKMQYDPSPSGCSSWYPALDPLSLKTCANLRLLDGCGNILEEWQLEHVYPQSIDWGDLEMTSYDIVTVDVTLKYDRAYQTYPFANHALYSTTVCASCTDPQCLPPVQGQGVAMGIMNQTVAFGLISTVEANDLMKPTSDKIGIPELVQLKKPDFMMV